MARTLSDVRDEAAADALARLVAPLHLMAYGPDGCEERELAHVEDLNELRAQWPVVWVSLSTVDPPRVEELGEAFGLHPLSVEDVLNSEDRPKFEAYDTYLYLVLNELHVQERLETEQVSLFFGDGWVLTIQQVPGDAWDVVRRRLRSGQGRIRQRGSDYLAYSLVDALVDSHVPMVEQLGERLDAIEDAILEHPTIESRTALHELRRDMLRLWRSLIDQREAVQGLQRAEDHVAKETRTFLRDVVDHLSQAIDLMEAYRERANDVRDLYVAEMNARLNEILRVLTILSTVFIPLTFLASVYGMNFAYMPELQWRWAYPIVLAGMAAIATFMLVWFRKRRWL